MTASIDIGYEDPEVWKRLEPLLIREQEIAGLKMASGGCKTWESYLESVGRWRALAWVRETVDKLNAPPPSPKAPDDDGY